MEKKDESVTQKILQKEATRRTFLKGALATAGGVAAWAAGAGAGAPIASAAAPAPKPKMKYLFAQRENCTGCRACEYACSLKHEGVVRPSVAKIHVRRYYSVIDIPVICWHCDDAPCVKACPTTPVAIVKDKETNAIKFIDDKTCLGAKCNKCIEACPAGFLRRHPDTGWPMFCDLCDGDPECVKACQEQAGNPQGPCLSAGLAGFGVNLAYRAVNPDAAAKALHLNLFYPNEKGERR
ncbi:MAG: 4Fe-4S dicluster domain-containing protein [Deltaproteobacteria bacterium]|nr:4Fe-4S dicluster domain-containing protein [Deltaproteobacteria bacterium]